MFRVAQADEQLPRLARGKQFFSPAVHHHERLAGFLPADFHVLPAKLRADASAERLGNRLLGREPGGDKRRGILVRQAIGNFIRQQDPLSEPLAKFFQRRLDARDFDDVNADAKNHFIYDLRFATGAQENSKLIPANAAPAALQNSGGSLQRIFSSRKAGLKTNSRQPRRAIWARLPAKIFRQSLDLNLTRENCLIRQRLKQAMADSNTYLNAGEALYNQGRHDEAKAEFEKLLALNPDDSEIHNWLGRVALIQRRFTDAEAFFRKAAALKPQSSAYSYNLGLALANQKRFPEAEAAYRRALELKKDNWDARRWLGSVLLEQGRYAEAKPEFEKALAQQPDDAEIHNWLGLVELRQGHYTDAEAFFRKAATLDPQENVYSSNLGLALANQKRYAEAEAAYRRALVLKPDYLDARRLLGSVLLEQGRYAEARAEFENAMALKPGDAGIQNWLGLVELRQGHYTDAEAFFRKAAEFDPREC